MKHVYNKYVIREAGTVPWPDPVKPTPPAPDPSAYVGDFSRVPLFLRPTFAALRDRYDRP